MTCDFRLITNECIRQQNDLYRWYRFGEVRGIEASSLIRTLNSNPNDSKPLGPRKYMVVDKHHVQTGDLTKIDNVNLYLSIIFFKSSYIHVPGTGIHTIGSIGLNGILINVNTDASYWGMYFTHMFYVMNRERLSDSNHSISSSDIVSKKSSFNKSNTRSYSTNKSKYDSNIIND